MIRSFRHKGIERFFANGSKAGIPPHHETRLRRQLTVLDAAKSAQGMNVPGWQLHALQGTLTHHWSVNVNGNRRLTFTFEGEDAILIDYQDYH